MNSSPLPAVSVVIPCFNVENDLPHQLAALVPQLGPEDEVVLVDNRSTDGTAELLRALAEQDPRLRGVPAMDKPGVNHARNCGILAARHRTILICDADDRVHPGWVDAFRVALVTNGLAGGVAVPVDQSGERIGPDLGLTEIFGGPAYALGGNMGLTREVFDAVGGFDESFIGGHDEADFAWRAAEAGWTARLVPGARLDYVQRPTPAGAVRQRRNYARTSIQLWAHHPHVAESTAVSFSGAVRRLARTLPAGARVARGSASLHDASEWGWAVGLVEGHLRYRILGSPPIRVLPAIPSDGGPAEGPVAG